MPPAPGRTWCGLDQASRLSRASLLLRRGRASQPSLTPDSPSKPGVRSEQETLHPRLPRPSLPDPLTGLLLHASLHPAGIRDRVRRAGDPLAAPWGVGFVAPPA